MLFANMHINIKPKIVSHMKNKHIEFDCESLGNILSISNEGPEYLRLKLYQQ
jgi:hypothetical protein